MDEHLYENFKLYFPMIEKGCISWRQTDTFELEIDDEDGRVYIYNDMNHSFGRKQVQMLDGRKNLQDDLEKKS